MRKNKTLYMNPLCLKPTQFCLGFKEIEHKENQIKKMSDEEYKKYLIYKVTPAIISPEGYFYIIDHHHHARSLINLQKPEIYIEIIEDCSKMNKNEFYNFLIEKKYVNLYDQNGVMKTIQELPPTLMDLSHDVYRSLAWQIREKKGFKKVDNIPFFEFRWGDFFRKYITEKLIEDNNPLAVEVGLSMAKSEKAKHLPGFKGKK